MSRYRRWNELPAYAAKLANAGVKVVTA